MRIDKDSRLINFYIPLFLLLAGFFWKLFYIGHRDICLDEPFTIFNAQKSIGEIINLSTANEPTPPLFMLLMHYWIKLFGIGPFSVRFLPLVFNAFTLPFIYFTGKRFFSFWTGLVASGLFLFSNYHFFFGLETRTYSLLSLETAASLYFYLRYTENLKDRRAITGLIISNLLLIYTHYFGWFVILSQVIPIFIYTRNLKKVFKFMIPSLATVFGYIPMFPIIIKQFVTKSNGGTWLNPPKPIDYLYHFYYMLNHKVVFWIIIAVIASGIIFTLILFIRKQWKWFNIRVLVLLLWWIIPYSIMFFASLKVPMFNNRYILFNTIGLYLFIPAVISLLYQKNKYFEPAVGLVVLMFMFVYLRILPDSFIYREVSKSVDFVKSNKDENSIVILYPYWSNLQFIYYYDREIFIDFQNCNRLMKKNGLYSVWDLQEVKQIVSANPVKRIIYIQDGILKDEKISIFRYLDSAYVKNDSVYFPQTIKVNIYDPKPR